MEKYIVGRSGARVYIGAEPEQGRGVLSIHDVWLSHCRTPMFAAASKRFYSVGHHVLGTARIAIAFKERSLVCLLGLLHEMETAVFGDVPGPVKTPEQRKHERCFRDRMFTELRVPFCEDAWQSMERYDKLEQAASVIAGVGLAETVHNQVWLSITDRERDLCLEIARGVYLEFPPAEQLGEVSALRNELISAYTILRNRVIEEVDPDNS